MVETDKIIRWKGLSNACDLGYMPSGREALW
jgi:hypothetical protein